MNIQNDKISNKHIKDTAEIQISKTTLELGNHLIWNKDNGQNHASEAIIDVDIKLKTGGGLSWTKETVKGKEYDVLGSSVVRGEITNSYLKSAETMSTNEKIDISKTTLSGSSTIALTNNMLSVNGIRLLKSKNGDYKSFNCKAYFERSSDNHSVWQMSAYYDLVEPTSS